MSDILKALDDPYRAEAERIERGPFLWVGNRNFITAVQERMQCSVRFPAIVIPNRTRRWFHNWKPDVDLIGEPHGLLEPKGRMLAVNLPSGPLALYFPHDTAPDLPGIYWTSIPGVLGMNR